MKRIVLFLAASIALTANLAGAATTTPVQLINPTGSTSGQVIKSNGPTTAPSWGGVSLSGATGTLAIANGGTGATSAATALSNLGGAALAGATFTGAITPSQTLGISGTTTNNNANAGSFGEYATNSNTGVALTTSTNTDIATLSLTAGDWDVQATSTVTGAGGASITTTGTSVSATSVTFGGLGTFWQSVTSGLGSNGSITQATPMVRQSLSATTTIYCVSNATFSSGTASASCMLRARRVR